MRTLTLGILFTLFLFSACSDSSQQQKAEADQQEQTTDVEKNYYTLTPFTSSQDFPDAKIESMNYENGNFAFGVGGESYKLGVQTPDAPQKMCANSAKGQHIHLIVDDQPYAAKYEAEFEYDVADGEHYLLAFLSRSYHESIKTSDAHVVRKVSVENKGITNQEDVSSPMLFYSRPKGTYIGESDTKKVMLDFYLANADLGEAYKVKAEINGEEHILDKWIPYYIEGMPMGENTIKLTLIDAEGNAVDTPLNPVERTFILKDDPAPTH
ncbi:MAG: phosphopeptide-binding protein [Bacteroidetes bacterium]|nr:phosphopeptide-binding protein [Bacteroidota bacterium]